MQRPVSPARIAAVAAAVLFVAAVATFGAMFSAFSQVAHPVAALGASGVPQAAAFNAIAFVLPGLLAAFVAQSLRARMRLARLLARIGVQAMTIAAVAFAAMGALPLDSRDLLSTASRAHSVAWTLWWLAFVAGATMLAVGMRGTPHAARSGAVAACAIVTLVFAVLLPGLLPPGLAQRVAFAGWLVAVWLAAPSRAAASAPGSSPTGPA